LAKQELLISQPHPAMRLPPQAVHAATVRRVLGCLPASQQRSVSSLPKPDSQPPCAAAPVPVSWPALPPPPQPCDDPTQTDNLVLGCIELDFDMLNDYVRERVCAHVGRR
jgi:hypothetical protein